MKKVFIDGKAGTTGLRIEERLSQRDDLEIVTIPEELRKDPVAKKKILNSFAVLNLFLKAFIKLRKTVCPRRICSVSS